MVKAILQIYPVLPAASEEERAALRPIGRNRELYQQVLTGWHDIVQAADALGFWVWRPSSTTSGRRATRSGPARAC